MSQKPFYTAWVVLSPAGDVAGAWIAHALEFDVVTQGDSAEHAYRMAAEAVEMVLADDLSRGADPFARRASAEFWQPLLELWEHGERMGQSEFLDRLHNSGDFGVFAVQMIFRPERGEVPSGKRTPSKPPYDAPLAFTTPSSAHAC
jgi:predicted RNase H-like HicB family nuclease